MPLKTFIKLAVLFAVLLSRTGWTEDAKQAADVLFQAKDYKNAAKAYEAITQKDPSDASAWMRLGQSQYSLGQFDHAIESFEKAKKAGAPQIPILLREARSYAKLGNKDKAFELLNQAMQSGFTVTTTLESDADLSSLKDDARWKPFLESMQKQATPCKFAPEYRQFDFWVGEWDVTAGGQPVGSSSVQLILDDCVLLENWTGAGGSNGKSFNLYNAVTKQWQQSWVDNSGTFIQFYGQYKDDQLQYHSESIGADGARTLGRMTFFKLPDRKVRQLWEQSTDDGKTWTKAFDGLYTPKAK